MRELPVKERLKEGSTYETVQLVEHIESGNPISVLQEGLVADIIGFVAFKQHGPDCPVVNM